MLYHPSPYMLSESKVAFELVVGFVKAECLGAWRYPNNGSSGSRVGGGAFHPLLSS